MAKRIWGAVATLLLLGGGALAEDAVRVRGTVVSPDGTRLRLDDRAGRDVTVPGAHVIVQARAGEGAVLTAERVTVGVDGLVPPM